MILNDVMVWLTARPNACHTWTIRSSVHHGSATAPAVWGDQRAKTVSPPTIVCTGLTVPTSSAAKMS